MPRWLEPSEREVTTMPRGDLQAFGTAGVESTQRGVLSVAERVVARRQGMGSVRSRCPRPCPRGGEGRRRHGRDVRVGEWMLHGAQVTVEDGGHALRKTRVGPRPDQPQRRRGNLLTRRAKTVLPAATVIEEPHGHQSRRVDGLMIGRDPGAGGTRTPPPASRSSRNHPRRTRRPRRSLRRRAPARRRRHAGRVRRQTGRRGGRDRCDQRVRRRATTAD
jgi:hypothetical protein